MNVNIKFITELSGENLRGIVRLWENVFSDSEEFISAVVSDDSYAGSAVAMFEDKIIGMAHLFSLEGENRAFYCYAVATSEEHRGKGIGKKIMTCLMDRCKEEKCAMLLHPADNYLEAFYKRLGFSSLSYSYEISCQGDEGDFYDISSSEYKKQRAFLFGGKGYYGWSESMLTLSGVRFIGFDIDGEYMCAAVSENKVCELCAPPDMMGKAARRAANIAEKVLMEETNPIGANVSVMGYNVSEYSYFNLFLD